MRASGSVVGEFVAVTPLGARADEVQEVHTERSLPPNPLPHRGGGLVDPKRRADKVQAQGRMPPSPLDLLPTDHAPGKTPSSRWRRACSEGEGMQ